MKAKMVEINKNLMKVLWINQQVKVVAHNCETCGGPHSYNDCPATIGKTQNVYAAGTYNQGGNSYQPQGASHGQNPPPAYQAPAYQAPGYQAPIHQAPIPQPQVVTTTEFTNYMKANDAILKNMQTNLTSLTNSNLELKNMFGQFMKMNIASSSGLGTLPGNTITNPKEYLKGITTRSGNVYKGPMIPTTSSPPKVVERETEVTKDSMPPTNNRSTKDVRPLVVQIETLIPDFEPVVALNVKPVEALISALKPNPKPKARGPGKFLIPCDFSGMDECLALANLGASINLMPLSVWNKLSLPELSPTCMTLELADLVDFDADPRVPLILKRSFLKTGCALIDVYEGKLTLRVGKEAITLNLDQNARYSVNYDAIEFLLEETDAFLAIDDVPISSQIDKSYYDSEGEILLLEEFLNDDPSSPPLPPQELKVVELTNEKSSIDEPPVVELKDLPPHLEYAFLEG
nr:reverse transcriptase domain-containing protein [Tanacetum cinerariifolium]